MTSPSALEYRKDFLGERLYASRNHNELRGSYSTAGCNRTIIDWSLTLRQGRKKNRHGNATASAPNLITLDRAEARADREIEPLAPEHLDGPYMADSATRGKYQNAGNTAHMYQGLVRHSSGDQGQIDWQLNLRDGHHQQPDKLWRRYYTRPQQSFDMMAENCAKNNEAYQKSAITPQDRRIDRRSGAISIETIRDDKTITFKRHEGCEGTQVGAWEHLLKDRRFGHKARSQMKFDSTLRVQPSTVDPNGARIQDNRSDGCLVEMMGKKTPYGHQSHEHLAARPPQGDPKLHHQYRLRVLPGPDEANRTLRMSRKIRIDADVPDVWQEKGAAKMF